MAIKAKQSQYEQAVDIYYQSGVDGVFKFAEENGLTSVSECVDCELKTPDTDDNCCLICGSKK
jgi:hypothetical protein